MRRVPFAFALVAILFISAGCFGPDFEALSPGQGSEYDDEIRGEAPTGSWHWVRGRVQGDVDGLRDPAGHVHAEEVLLVTRHSGERKAPGPIESAWLVVCRIHPDSEDREPLARYPLYGPQADGVPATPESTLFVWNEAPLEDGTIELTDLDGDGVLEILARLWRPAPEGVAVLHRAFSYRADGTLFPFFACAAVQPANGLQRGDIDKDGVDELIVETAILPPRPEDAPRARPAWPCIYTSSEDGQYRQDNAKFGNHYDTVLTRLYEDLEMDRLLGSAETAPVHTYYIGLVYAYRQETAMARLFLQRAAEAPGNVGSVARQALSGLEPPPAESSIPRAPDLH